MEGHRFNLKMKKRLSIGLKLLFIVALVFGLFQAGQYIWPRYRLDQKGYTKAEIEAIMTLSKEQQEALIEMDHLENFNIWFMQSQKFDRYFLYQSYQECYPNLEAEEIVKTVDMIEENPDVFAFSDHQDKTVFYEKADPQVISDYMDSASERTLASNPGDLTVLVKEDAQISISYEPADLEACVLENADEADGTLYMAKEANQALKQMAQAAQEEGYILLNNSSYRSYFDQEDLYQYYLELYGEAYCEQYVAKPGISEHQTGLAIDLSCQAVQDGIYFVFGDSPDYEWVMEHCYEYGFIRRYPEEKGEITGVANEPWHFRYVGKEAAKIIYENDWVLEEYQQNLN